MPPPRDQSAERDARQIEQMEKLRAKANQTGAAADATTFVERARDAAPQQGRRAPQPAARDAGRRGRRPASIARARSGPEEAHCPWPAKGELYIEFGRNE